MSIGTLGFFDKKSHNKLSIDEKMNLLDLGSTLTAIIQDFRETILRNKNERLKC